MELLYATAILQERIRYHRMSFVWGGIKVGLELVNLDVRWIICKESNKSLWRDAWLNGRALDSFMQRPPELEYTSNFKVSDFILDKVWSIPLLFQNLFPVVTEEIIETPIADGEEDELVWDGASNGVLTVNAAYNHYKEKKSVLLWRKAVWRKFIPPKLSLLSWKISSRKLTTSDRLFKWGLIPTPVCTGCIDGTVETVNHIFFKCSHAQNAWSWLSSALDVDLLQKSDANEIMKWAANQKKRCSIGQLRLSRVMHT